MIEILTRKDNKIKYITDLSGEKTLLTLLQEQEIYIAAPCNGAGECGRCKVRFLQGAPNPTEKERRLLCCEQIESGVRLACVTYVTQPCRIILDEVQEERMSVLMDENVESQIDCSTTDEKGYGIAIDIGTTTLAAELFELSNGRTVSVASGVNHQRAYGADVISRICAANDGKGRLLQKSIRDDIILLTEKLRGNTIKLQEIKKVVIVGNTTMCHLLRGLSCEGLGCAPFVPTDNSLYETDAKQLLEVPEWNAKITILPGISAFVGADIVAGICASEMDLEQSASLLLDIGTNGEMVLRCDGEFLVTSTAAGPVFEGGGVSCGVPGIPGAICHIAFKQARWKYETIDGMPPSGICGTGIIDVISSFMDQGWMDENGTLLEPWFTDGIELVEGITFCQKDIREVQMGKAAIRAGIETLLAEYNKIPGQQKTQNLPTIYLAGGLGHYMDIANAIHIGLFPETFAKDTKCIGNAALVGAKCYLLSETETKMRIERIIAQAKEINLAEQSIFQELYLTHMFF